MRIGALKETLTCSEDVKNSMQSLVKSGELRNHAGDIWRSGIASWKTDVLSSASSVWADSRWNVLEVTDILSVKSLPKNAYAFF